MIKVDSKEIVINRFPNGEILVDTTYLTNLQEGFRTRVDFKWVNNEDILSLYFVLNHIKNKAKLGLDLYIYYLPFSRMDRSQNGSCFTLDYICSLISSALPKDSNVLIVEPHSDVCIKLFASNDIKAKRLNFITPLMDKILSEHNDIDVICYPDKGARDRFKNDSLNLPIIYCEKVRDFNTGEIKGLQLMGHLDLEGKNVLILDDLCSKGGTFYYTAKQLKENNVNKIYLGVCHMEQTVKYGSILQEYKNWDEVEPSIIDHIFCSNSMLFGTELNGYSNVTIYDIQKFVEQGIISEYEEDDDIILV